MLTLIQTEKNLEWYCNETYHGKEPMWMALAAQAKILFLKSPFGKAKTDSPKEFRQYTDTIFKVYLLSLSADKN